MKQYMYGPGGGCSDVMVSRVHAWPTPGMVPAAGCAVSTAFWAEGGACCCEQQLACRSGCSWPCMGCLAGQASLAACQALSECSCMVGQWFARSAGGAAAGMAMGRTMVHVQQMPGVVPEWCAAPPCVDARLQCWATACSACISLCMCVFQPGCRCAMLCSPAGPASTPQDATLCSVWHHVHVQQLHRYSCCPWPVKLLANGHPLGK
jgi:hypothetical protein